MGPGGRGNFTHELSHSTGGNFTAPRLFPPPVGWRGAPYPTGGKLFTQDNLIIPGMENYTKDVDKLQVERIPRFKLKHSNKISTVQVGTDCRKAEGRSGTDWDNLWKSRGGSQVNLLNASKSIFFRWSAGPYLFSLLWR